MATADSADYIFTARINLYGGVRPMGYSYFLMLVHFINQTYNAISVAQYIIMSLSVLYFLFTVKYFIKPLNSMAYLVFCFIVILSPLTLYLTHWVMSDSLFSSLTLVWLASGIWLLKRINLWAAFLHLFTLYLALNVRYAGFIYPVITIVTLLFVYRKRGILISVVAAVIPWMIYSQVKTKTKELFKVDTFSGFSGWVKANNATAILPHIEHNPFLTYDARLGFVHQFVSSFPDSVFHRDHVIETSFMWNNSFPGKQLLYEFKKKMPFKTYVEGWIYTGTVLDDYGNYLIKRYPLKYFRYFILMNTGQVFWPKITIGKYNTRQVDKITNDWYNPGIETFKARYDIFGRFFPSLLRWSNALLWLVLTGSLVLHYKNRKADNIPKEQKQLFFFCTVFLLLFVAFSIYAHPVHLRYLVPVHAVQVLLIYLSVKNLTFKRVYF